MYTINVHNDGKEKWQSFEATVNNTDDYLDLTGYGATQEEAIEELKKKVDEYIKKLQGIDYSKINKVDWAGKPI